MLSGYHWRTSEGRVDIEEDTSKCPVCRGYLQFMEASYLCPICGYSQEDKFIDKKFQPPY